MTIDIKGENKKAADWLLNYQSKRAAYIEAVEGMQEFNVIGSTEYTGMPRGGGVSNPSERMGLTLVDYTLQAPELELQRNWILTIEDVEKVFSEKKLVFLELRRRAANLEFNTVGRPAWTGYVQVKYADWFYRKYGKASVPSRQAMLGWWNEMVDITVRLAIRKGCM